jgi:rod shape determining protein RodA
MSSNSLIPAPIAQLPWRFLGLLIAIGCFGSIILYSAAGGSVTPWAASHLLRLGVFMTMAIMLSRMRETTWKDLAFPVYGVIVIMLFGVELLGKVSGGSQRWLDLGIIRLQPSELMKPAIILALARFYDMLPSGEIRRWNAIWPAALMIGVPAGLILIQPDLGTAMMVGLGGMVIMFLAGLPLRLFVIGGGAVAGALPIVFSQLHDYQKKRILIFLDPESDPLGAGYHITQSKIAIGSGGIFGKGYLNGSQSHLEYLPEGHTDFVFATMAEEWGLLGGLAIIIMFILVARWGMNVADRAPTRFGRLTAAGLTMTIFFYVMINLLMVMGLAPVVGIPLPLVSHGGTAMMTVMICAGILMSINRASRHSRILR